MADIPLDSPSRLEQLKWIWIDGVFSRTNDCKIVGTHIAREKFQDFSAKTGSFFYVINPCIIKERSSKNEQCSFNLVFTQSVSYENSMTKEFLRVAEDLSQAEGILAGLYSQLYYYSQIIHKNQDECEEKYAFDQSRMNFWKGLTSLTFGSVGAVVGGLVSGGTAALQGFQTGLGVAVGFFGKQAPLPLVCPLVDESIKKATATSGLMEGAFKNVLELRQKLATLNHSYAALDGTIWDQFISSKQEGQGK